MSYVSNTDDDKREMLESLGISSGNIEELFRSIPPELRAKSFDLPPGKSELEVEKYITNLAGRNATGLVTFVGGGFYDHHIPAAVDALAGRSEFYTSYTPYQAEVSQGTLQAIYEYQSLICRLTGMDIANASGYDGASVTADAAPLPARDHEPLRLGFTRSDVPPRKPARRRRRARCPDAPSTGGGASPCGRWHRGRSQGPSLARWPPGAGGARGVGLS